MSQPKKGTRKAPDPAMPLRKTQTQQIAGIADECEERAKRNRKEREQRSTLLESVLDGLQQEIDKLLKKSPVDQVSDLMLEEVNQVIRDTRVLLAHDEYVQRQKEFVPAGENPEIRDVSLALTQLKRGLQRFRKGREELDAADTALTREAKTIAVALQMYVEDGRKQIRADEIREYIGGVSGSWIDQRGVFDFNKLDQTDLAEYFKVAK